MNIAIIPGRGGSKRIPGKNSKIFFGQPMITWSIKRALGSKIFDKVIVSTEDKVIAEISRSVGAETPFVRPDKLADDFTTTVPVIAHAIESCEEMGWHIEYACCIYPCAPLLQDSDLIHGFDLIRENDVDYVYPVTDYPHPIQRAMLRSSSGHMQFLQPACELSRTQDLERYYHDAGQFYWGKASAWKAGREMHSSGIGMVIPRWRVIDVDTVEDWKHAELLYEVFKNSLG